PECASLDAPHFPPTFDPFRVEWERAAWANAGRPSREARAKFDLLRWRLHALLGELTGDLVHFHEAALLRPDLPGTRAALGGALCGGGGRREAVAHLGCAVAGTPFAPAAARALQGALLEAGAPAGAGRLARQRSLLRAAAPGVVPLEPWFAPGPPPAGALA